MMKKRGQGITRVSDLFSKYIQTLKAPQGTVIKAFIEVVEELFKTTIQKDQCTYTPSSQTLVLRISGPLKSEIIMQKKKILIHLAEKLGEKNSPKEIL